jgi:hypothetical protein
LSDYTLRPFKAYFLHLNPRHHSFAMIETGHNSVHHMMVELFMLDDVGQAYDLALGEDGPIATTMGRHSNDFMTSFYARTPSGFFVEYGWGGRSIDPATHSPVEMTCGPSLWGHDRDWLTPERRPGGARVAAARGGRRPPRAGAGAGRQLHARARNVCVVGRGPDWQQAVVAQGFSPAFRRDYTWRRRGPWSRIADVIDRRRWGGCRSASSSCARPASFSTASTSRWWATSRRRSSRSGASPVGARQRPRGRQLWRAARLVVFTMVADKVGRRRCCSGDRIFLGPDAADGARQFGGAAHDSFASSPGSASVASFPTRRR